MFISDSKDCEEFMSAGEAILKELLHPDKADLKIGYSLAHAVVRPGKTTLPHRLKTSEVYYIMEGKGIMYIDEENSNVGSGMAIYIPPGAKQNIHNPGDRDLIFLCMVDPAWREEDEEVL
jgi:mannose-6-phosphate isomerase-like protein (cupin superfamily)